MSTLEKQVNAEVKKKQMIFFTVIILTIVYLTISLVFGDMGFIKYLELNRTRASLQQQIAQISSQNEQLKIQLKALKGDPFTREKIAREEYGLSKPDEYIFQYDR